MKNAKSNQFSSRLGFIMAAAGSAVGVGNIWGFPTQAASNGGGAFLLVYLILICLLGYPMLMAELMIGRHGQTNPADAMAKLGQHKWTRSIGKVIGLASIITALLICSFYTILSGWFVSFALASVSRFVGFAQLSSWFIDFSVARNVFFTSLLIVMAVYIIRQGVQQGIEKWSKRLMPLLLAILLGGAIYILTLPGAMQGLSLLFKPDFSRILDTQVLNGGVRAKHFFP